MSDQEPTTYDQLLAAATKVAELNERVRQMGMWNVADVESRVAVDAEYKIIDDLRARAESEYQSLLSRYQPEGSPNV